MEKTAFFGGIRMKLYIKQRLFSWTDSFDIYDENMDKKYTAKADFLTIGHRIRVFYRFGGEIGYIQEKLLRIFAEFDVHIGGRYLGRIKRKMTFFIPKYDIDYNGWSIEGDFFGWNYSVRQPNGLVAANITRELFHLTDTYSIEIFDDSDEINVLMLVLAIDAANCSKNNS